MQKPENCPKETTTKPGLWRTGCVTVEEGQEPESHGTGWNHDTLGARTAQAEDICNLSLPSHCLQSQANNSSYAYLPETLSEET